MTNAFTPQLIATHIQKYLDQKVLLEDIYKGFMEQGVSEEIWNASIVLIQSKEGVTESKQPENKKKSNKVGKTRITLIILISIFFGLFLGTYLTYFSAKENFVNIDRSLYDTLLRKEEESLKSVFYEKLWKLEKEKTPMSEEKIKEEKMAIIDSLTSYAEDYSEYTKAGIKNFSYLRFSLGSIIYGPRRIIYMNEIKKEWEYFSEITPYFEGKFYEGVIE